MSSHIQKRLRSLLALVLAVSMGYVVVERGLLAANRTSELMGLLEPSSENADALGSGDGILDRAKQLASPQVQSKALEKIAEAQVV